MKTKAELIPECPVATTVQLIGNKWKLVIIRNLLQRPWRFNELQKNRCSKNIYTFYFVYAILSSDLS